MTAVDATRRHYLVFGVAWDHRRRCSGLLSSLHVFAVPMAALTADSTPPPLHSVASLFHNMTLRLSFYRPGIVQDATLPRTACMR